MGHIHLAVLYFILQSHVSLASITVPFISNMMLGRTFDYSKSMVGNDIFSQDAQNNIESTNSGQFIHKFMVVESARDMISVLDISGELSLKVMAGVVSVEGKGGYLKSSVENENTVEVLAQTFFTTKVKRFKDSVKPMNIDWDKEKIIGQHYIESVTYGGYLIASLKFTAKKSEEKEKISAQIKGDVKAAKVDVSLQGLFDKLISKTSDSTDLSISYTSTLIPEIIPVDYKTLIDNIKEFSQQIKKTHGGEGVPIKAGLKELKYLDKRGPAFRITSLLKEELRVFAVYYHDLKTTSDEIAKSLENMQLTVEQEKVFGEFNARIWKMMEVFFSTIDNLDLNEQDGGKVGQLKKAKKEYGRIPGYYLREFRQLARKYPVYESDENYEIPLDLTKMQNILQAETDKFISIQKLTSGSRIAVSFPQKDAGNYMIARGKPSDMTDITACFSAKSAEKSLHQTFLSYGTIDSPNEFVVASSAGKLIVMRRKSERKFGSDFGINDGAWHAWCFSWSKAGQLQVFKDGVKLKESKIGTTSGKVKGGGVWMVGQAQLDGKPDGPDKSYKGEMTSVNIFEEATEEFGKQASERKCLEPDVYTNIVRPWRDFRRGKVGDIKVLKKNTACPAGQYF